MSVAFEGIGASPGRVLGYVRILEWEIPPIEHRTIGPEEVELEVERFELARKAAIARVSMEPASGWGESVDSSDSDASLSD